MKRVIAAVVLLMPVLVLSGCAGPGTREISGLRTRMAALEDRQDAVEARVTSPQTGVTYVSSPQPAPSPARRIDPAKMTVRDIQTALQRAGYYRGAIDGIAGPLTQRAVTEFQRDKRLKVDGIVGPQTRRALVEYL